MTHIGRKLGALTGLMLAASSAFVVGPLIPEPTEVTTYYVDATGGLDSNDGLTPETAWQTLAKVNGATFAPGNRILFKAGETFSGGLILREGQHYGSSSHQIVYSSYGVGVATIQASTNDQDGVDALNPHHVTIQNLKFIGTGDTVSTARGVHARNNSVDDSSKLDDVRILNLDVSEYGIDGIAFLPGVIDDSSAATSGFNAPLIDGCVVYNCTGNTVTGMGMGIAIRGVWGMKLHPASVIDPVIQNCIVHDCTGKTGLGNHSGNGIFMGEGVDGGLIQHCLAYNNGALGTGSVGIWMADCTNTTIQFCVTRGQRTSAGASDGGGFDIDGGCQNCLIQYCYAVNCDGPGYLLYQWDSLGVELLPLSNNTIRYCISENNSATDTDKYGEVVFGTDESTDASGNFIYGNVFYNDHVDGSAMMPYTGTTNRFINGGFFNNILIAASGKVIQSWGTVVPPASFLIQGNLYWPVAAATSIKWGATTYNSVEAWRTATGKETDGSVNTAVILDPELIGVLPVGPVDTVTDAALNAYVTGVDSPARGRGRDIEALTGTAPIRDFFGNTVPQADYDIGCFESNTLTPFPLQLSGSPATSGEDGLAYSFSPTTSFGVMPYTYSLVGTWPAGISINPSTGEVSGTPTEVGEFTGLNVQVTDANLDTAQLSSSFTLTILPENLLRDIAWVAGLNTNMQDMGNGRIRVQRSGGNPSAYKPVTLQPGHTYRLKGNVWNNASFGSFAVKVAEPTTLNSNYSYNGATLTTDTAFDTTFVAAAGATWHFGILYFTGTNDSRYVEIEKAFRLEYVSAP